MDLKKIFANCQKHKLEVSYGYFVHWHHDLYGGLSYNGVFDSEKMNHLSNMLDLAVLSPL